MSTELSWQAQEVIYQVRHTIRREPLDEALALRHARAMTLEPVMGVSPEDEYRALLEALASDAALARWHGHPELERVIPEEEFRAHLRRVVERLDAMRPWPVPLYRALAPETYGNYGSARLVGVIRLDVADMERRLGAHLLPMARLEGGRQVRVIVLELRSGNEIALVGHWWPEDRDATAVLTRDPDVSASELMVELTSGDHFEQGEYEVLG